MTGNSLQRSVSVGVGHAVGGYRIPARLRVARERVGVGGPNRLERREAVCLLEVLGGGVDQALK